MAEVETLLEKRLQQSQGIDRRERLVVLSLEFSRRALEAKSLDELYFILTNDIRALVEFDRGLLVTHMLGQSRFVSASNQPMLEGKSKFHGEVEEFAAHLRHLDKPLLLASPEDIHNLPGEALAPELKEAVIGYMETSGCNGIFCLPLLSKGEAVGHLILEYLDTSVPDQLAVFTLVKLAPVFGAALAQQWILHQHPGLAPLTETPSWANKPLVRRVRPYAPFLAIAMIALLLLIFIVPFPYTVGGEVEIVPHDRHVAFCKMDGLVDAILVQEGSQVEKGQVLALLDPKELEHKIRTGQRQVELLTAEMMLLKKSGGQDISKLAEGSLVELKRNSALAELDFLKWEEQFLRVTAPAPGIIVTKQIETLVGKKFKAGEPFCEIATPGDLWAEIAVPDDKVTYVRTGQDGDAYFNSAPLTGYPLKVTEIAPRAEAIPRLGNVYRVRAVFTGTKPPAQVGMKGIGKIYSSTSTLWSIAVQRLGTRWNYLSLYFW